MALSYPTFYNYKINEECIYINRGQCLFFRIANILSMKSITIGTQADTYNDMKNIFWKQQAFPALRNWPATHHGSSNFLRMESK